MRPWREAPSRREREVPIDLLRNPQQLPVALLPAGARLGEALERPADLPHDSRSGKDVIAATTVVKLSLNPSPMRPRCGYTGRSEGLGPHEPRPALLHVLARIVPLSVRASSSGDGPGASAPGPSALSCQGRRSGLRPLRSTRLGPPPAGRVTAPSRPSRRSPSLTGLETVGSSRSESSASSASTGPDSSRPPHAVLGVGHRWTAPWRPGQSPSPWPWPPPHRRPPSHAPPSQRPCP